MYNIENQREGSKWKIKLDTKYKWMKIGDKGKIMNASLLKGNKKSFKKESIHPFKEGKYFDVELKYLHSDSNQLS